mmetsp:Transcript_8074/g.36708  ORF Transcript_8074/g.36708 Transcript_8074/m.36708 type:complete len:246 (+) Transcript_8074:3623-4360(+)
MRKQPAITPSRRVGPRRARTHATNAASSRSRRLGSSVVSSGFGRFARVRSRPVTVSKRRRRRPPRPSLPRAKFAPSCSRTSTPRAAAPSDPRFSRSSAAASAAAKLSARPSASCASSSTSSSRRRIATASSRCDATTRTCPWWRPPRSGARFDPPLACPPSRPAWRTTLSRGTGCFCSPGSPSRFHSSSNPSTRNPRRFTRAQPRPAPRPTSSAAHPTRVSTFDPEPSPCTLSTPTTAPPRRCST